MLLNFSTVYFINSDMALIQKQKNGEELPEKQNYVAKIKPISQQRIMRPNMIEPKLEPSIYNEEEINMIEAVVMAEVGQCSRESKIAVTNVILNRVASSQFGASIPEVLYAKGQFASISNYTEQYLPVDEDCEEAVIAALNGENNSKGALYYYAPQYVKNKNVVGWFESLNFVVELDGQRFFKD